MVLYGELEFDARVRREALSLAGAGHHVTVVCFDGEYLADTALADVRVIGCSPRDLSPLPGERWRPVVAPGHGLVRVLDLSRWLTTYGLNLHRWGRAAGAAVGDVDVWHAHDLTGLVAISSRLAGDSLVVYDSHEVFTETGFVGRMPWIARALVRKLERRLVARTVALITVNESVARIFKRRYRPRRLVVVYNATPRSSPPSEVGRGLRARLGLTDPTRLVLYHGAIGPGRGIDETAEAMLLPGLEDVHLVFMGFGPQYEHAERLSSDRRYMGRIHVLPSVPPDMLAAVIASADVGVIAMQPTTLNLRMSTPNKLFECIGAGIPVVVSDFPEMRSIVRGGRDGPLGETCDPTDPASIAAALRRILDLEPAAYQTLRRRCLAAAHERWNWETEARKLVDLYADLAASLSGPARKGGRDSDV